MLMFGKVFDYKKVSYIFIFPDNPYINLIRVLLFRMEHETMILCNFHILFIFLHMNVIL